MTLPAENSSISSAGSIQGKIDKGRVMQFSSLFFIAVFLPVYLAVYVCAPEIQKKNRVLLLASLLFYAFGGIQYLFLLLVMTAVGWIMGIRIVQNERLPQRKKIDLILSAAVFLFVLGIFKYSGFFGTSLNQLFHTNMKVIRMAMPLGISFYTFKLISYVADVYTGKIGAENNYANLLMYTACFHHVLQGPIIRYGDLLPQFTERNCSWQSLSAGIWRFCIGVSKKTILADHCGELADNLLPLGGSVSAMPVTGIWLGSVFFTLQMYLDFSAYTDMAIGLGQMAGFRYMENFNYPYLADSVKDFWRRWHISLSTFFRDYVYIPLGGNRKGEKRTVLNLLAVWALTGLWHGASWNFVLWGLFYFAFLLFERYLTRRDMFQWNPVLRHVYAVFVFNLGWIFFRFSDFGQLGAALKGFFGISSAGFSSSAVAISFENNIFFLIFSILACTPVFRMLGRRLRWVFQERRWNKGIFYGTKTVLAVLLLLLSVIALTGSSFRPFLYNQF